MVSAILFIALSVTAFLKGRLYCNTICPAGTLAGLISRYSMFRVKIDAVPVHIASWRHDVQILYRLQYSHYRYPTLCGVSELPVKCSGGYRYGFAWKRTDPASVSLKDHNPIKQKGFDSARSGAGAAL